MTLRPIPMDLGAPAHQPPAATASSAMGYAPRAGIPQLREALHRRLTTRSSLSSEDLCVTVTAGASMAFTSVLAGLTDPGDRVLLPDPGFPAYHGVARALSRAPEYYSLTGLLSGSSELLPRLSESKVLVLNSPSNPTGNTVPEALLKRLVETATKHGVVIVSDEVYADLSDPPPLSPAAAAPEATVILDSISKSFALAGARVGCAAGPADLIDRVTRAHWLLGMSVSEPSQHLAAKALTAHDGYLESVRNDLGAKRHLCAETLREHGIDCDPPDAGLFLWLDVTDIGSGTTIAEVLRRTVNVQVAAGEPFGPSGRGHIRLSCAGDVTEVSEGARRVARTLAALRLRNASSEKKA